MVKKNKRVRLKSYYSVLLSYLAYCLVIIVHFLVETPKQDKFLKLLLCLFPH